MSFFFLQSHDSVAWIAYDFELNLMNRVYVNKLLVDAKVSDIEMGGLSIEYSISTV